MQGKYHKVIFDIFFSLVSFLKELKRKNILVYGTIRPNRKDLPVIADEKSLERGDFEFKCTSDGVSLYKSNDSKPVHLISNYHEIETATVQRKQIDGAKVTITLPQIVKDYNQKMGGWDKHDMLRQLYEINRKIMKWWHRLLFGSLDMAVVNTYVVHNASKKQQLLFLKFRRDLSMGLLTRSFARGCRSSGIPKKCKIA